MGQRCQMYDRRNLVDPFDCDIIELGTPCDLQSLTCLLPIASPSEGLCWLERREDFQSRSSEDKSALVALGMHLLGSFLVGVLEVFAIVGLASSAPHLRDERVVRSEASEERVVCRLVQMLLLTSRAQ